MSLLLELQLLSLSV